MNQRSKRALECALLFGVAPLGLVMFREHARALLFPALWLAAAACAHVLRRDPTFERARLWRWSAVRASAPRILLEVAVGGALLGAGLALWDPGLLFAFPRARPLLWLAVLAFYPLLSAWPQEIVYRAFFFHRYGGLFASERALCIASALAFAWGHAFLGTWIALVLPTAGGVLFARTFARTRSTLAATAEHGLWGDVVFTIGWGYFLWAGSI